MNPFLNQAVAAIFYVLILLLGSGLILAPTILLWLSLQRLWPTWFAIKVWQITLVAILLALISSGLLPSQPQQNLLDFSLLAFQLTFSWGLCLVPLQLVWQLWLRKTLTQKDDVSH